MAKVPDVKPGEKSLLSGNEAVALASLQSGVIFASGYPGTPSSEIIESFIAFYKMFSSGDFLPEGHELVRAEWAPNEKVALEAVAGASIAGARAFYTSKHVGLNVASDPLVSFVHTGVNAGAVLFVADDPFMHSSQNEQDTRWYSLLSKIPVFEPSDGQEAYQTVLKAFDISEKYDLPVLIRLTTRVSHSRWVVEVSSDFAPFRKKSYRKNPQKYVLIPAYARLRKASLIERIEKFRKGVSEENFEAVVVRGGSVGILTSSIAYRYVLEALNLLGEKLSVFKPLVSNPFPEEGFLQWVRASGIKKILVVEEGDNFLEREVKKLLFENKLSDVEVLGKPPLPLEGELSPEVVVEFIEANLESPGRELAGLLHGDTRKIFDELSLPPRPPVLCPGCPYRGVFYVLRKRKAKVVGDIGCYSLGVLPPLNSMDTLLDMGAGFGMAHSFSLYEDRVIGLLGDSTFFHSGIAPAINVVYNMGNASLLVLDNRTTAMTGHQPHPGIERTAMGEPTRAVAPEDVARALGFKKIKVFDPFDLKETEEVIKEALESKEPCFLVARGTCALLKEPQQPYIVDGDRCTGCKICFSISCPAIIKVDESWKAEINPSLCNGCGVCAQVCPFGAIIRADEQNPG